VVGAFRNKWIRRIWISWSCGVHRLFSLSNVSNTRSGRLHAASQ
jgi:hypothetical protein